MILFFLFQQQEMKVLFVENSSQSLPGETNDRNSISAASLCIAIQRNAQNPLMRSHAHVGKGKKYKKSIDVISGKRITVEFDRPCALQIDGETVIGVTTYTAWID